MKYLTAPTTLFLLASGVAALAAQAPPAGAQTPAPAPKAEPREQRLNLIFRVVRVPFTTNGKPSAEPQVVQTRTTKIYQNIPAAGILGLRHGLTTKNGRELPSSALKVSLMSLRKNLSLASDEFAFEVDVSARFQDDDSAALSTSVRARGALPVNSRWRYVNRMQAATQTGEQRLVPGQAPARIAHVKAWTSDEARRRALEGEAPTGEAYTAYYLEVAAETVPPPPPSAPHDALP